MFQTMKSAFLLAALEYVLEKGLEFVQTYTEEKKAEVESFVKNLIPGEDFDALGWSVVDMLMPKVFEIAAELVDKINGVEDRNQRTALLFQAVRSLAA